MYHDVLVTERFDPRVDLRFLIDTYTLAFGPTYVHDQPPDPSEEAAASKLWAVYASEAEKYDRSLVESWKSDMEGMLILASVFYSTNINI
jgi:hypothetical protein